MPEAALKKIFKVLGIALLLIVVAALAAYAWAFSTANRKYQQHWAIHESSFPIPWALADSEVAELRQQRFLLGAPAKVPLSGVNLDSVALARAIARGEHLVQSRVGCFGCHGDDFGGHVVVNVPVVGYWAAPNLTSGEGGVTRGFDATDWDRVVRHGVRHDGRSSSMPSDDFKNLSDHELSDIVTYIRSRPPVNRDVGHVRFGPVFVFLTATDPKALPAFVIDHQKPHDVEPPAEDSTVALGDHIAQVCRGCHGPNLSGGKVQGDPNLPIVANITPHESGIKTWAEADFVRAMREGKRPDGTAINTAMPWQAFGKMKDVELAALWAYLRTVPPAPKGVR